MKASKKFCPITDSYVLCPNQKCNGSIHSSHGNPRVISGRCGASLIIVRKFKPECLQVDFCS